MSPAKRTSMAQEVNRVCAGIEALSRVDHSRAGVARSGRAFSEHEHTSAYPSPFRGELHGRPPAPVAKVAKKNKVKEQAHVVHPWH